MLRMQTAIADHYIWNCYVDDENILKSKCKTKTMEEEQHNKYEDNDPGRQNNDSIEENAFPAPRVWWKIQKYFSADFTVE